MSSRRRARVLVMVKGLGIGGAERLISEGARCWDRDRFDYHVAFALPWKDQLVPQLKALGVPIHCFGTLGRTSFPSVVGLRRLLRTLEPDLVHAHLPTMGVAARLFSAQPVVYTEHNLASSYHAFTRLANRLTYGRNQAVIAVSPAVASSLAGYRGPKPQVIVNAVDCHLDPEIARAAREELAIGADVPLVVHVGNVRPGKGHHSLVRAAAILRQGIPELRVVSIGGEKRPGALEEMNALISDLGLQSNIVFLGRREDALVFVSAADVFVNPSEVEGMPLAVLEAMALGRPVVATAVGGVPDLVRHEKDGLLVPPGDPVALAESIKRLLSDRSLAARLGERARSQVEESYNLPAMVARIEAVYDQVLSAGVRR